jgi:predicted acyl esterase
MTDGATLAADVYLPDGDGPWPAVLLSFPYSKDVWLGVSYSNYLAYFAATVTRPPLPTFEGPERPRAS